MGCSGAATIGDIFMALDDAGVRRRTNFFTDTLSIYCVAEYGSGDNAVTLTGAIRQRQLYNPATDQMENTNRVLSLTETVPGKGPTRRVGVAFTKRNEAGQETVGNELPYPAGKFECEISLDGKLFSKLPFGVSFAPCPDGQITQRAGCRGFFKPNAVCPKYGSSSTDGATCTCDATNGNWACQE